MTALQPPDDAILVKNMRARQLQYRHAIPAAAIAFEPQRHQILQADCTRRPSISLQAHLLQPRNGRPARWPRCDLIETRLGGFARCAISLEALVVLVGNGGSDECPEGQRGLVGEQRVRGEAEGVGREARRQGVGEVRRKAHPGDDVAHELGGERGAGDIQRQLLRGQPYCWRERRRFGARTEAELADKLEAEDEGGGVWGLRVFGVASCVEI